MAAHARMGYGVQNWFGIFFYTKRLWAMIAAVFHQFVYLPLGVRELEDSLSLAM